MSTTMGYSLAGALFAVAALANWYAVATHHRRVVVIAKPLALAALIGVALSGGAASHTAGRWLLLGLALCLAGDVFLLSTSEPAFLGGLTSFLLGHGAYVMTFVSLRLSEKAWGLIGLMALIACLLAARRVVPQAAEEGGAVLAGAVVAYMIVIGAMVIIAWMTGEWIIGVGATAFTVSDSILSVNRFVQRYPRGDLAVMVTYHLAQVLIVVGVLRALAG